MSILGQVIADVNSKNWQPKVTNETILRQNLKLVYNILASFNMAGYPLFI